MRRKGAARGPVRECGIDGAVFQARRIGEHCAVAVAAPQNAVRSMTWGLVPRFINKAVNTICA
jgi:hypothetical protein